MFFVVVFAGWSGLGCNQAAGVADRQFTIYTNSTYCTLFLFILRRFFNRFHSTHFYFIFSISFAPSTQFTWFGTTCLFITMGTYLRVHVPTH